MSVNCSEALFGDPECEEHNIAYNLLNCINKLEVNVAKQVVKVFYIKILLNYKFFRIL